ncbi:MAG: hypothetical protein JO097_09145 [Acidobacteriaceae bacterium]|nr:hypothetical protein [Acidobacteriaceae bacterium]MBV9294477.1 hypothetical protein [Acidobacteriaceae bacterium]MBV9763588.1 hypothetical protein [Acidobacteriaceae bacterium]
MLPATYTFELWNTPMLGPCVYSDLVSPAKTLDAFITAMFIRVDRIAGIDESKLQKLIDAGKLDEIVAAVRESR